jgi:hypothetical protein
MTGDAIDPAVKATPATLGFGCVYYQVNGTQNLEQQKSPAIISALKF